MRKLGRTVLALGGWWWITGAYAQEAEPEPGPDLDFLEYLGAWAEDDDEWLAIEEWQKDNGKSGDEQSPDSERNEDDESE